MITISDSSEAVFNPADLKNALFTDGQPNGSSYVCSQSLFACDLMFNADPSVTNSVLSLMISNSNF